MTSITAMAMTDFVREVRARCDGAIDPAEMSRFLAANRIEAASLDGFVRFAPGRYMRHLVHKDRDVEILVLCWARGSTAPIHGHEGEYCWARVERGRLAFASYREASRAPLRLEPLGSAVDAGPGYVDGPADIHAVTNPTVARGGRGEPPRLLSSLRRVRYLRHRAGRRPARAARVRLGPTPPRRRGPGQRPAPAGA
jgi:NitT/TauT family transport system ATP-binding protein